MSFVREDVDMKFLEDRMFDDEKRNTLRYYEEADIKDFEYDSLDSVFTYPCPCGDRFEISMDDLLNGEEIASCPSCPLILRVVYEQDDIARFASSGHF